MEQFEARRLISCMNELKEYVNDELVTNRSHFRAYHDIYRNMCVTDGVPNTNDTLFKKMEKVSYRIDELISFDYMLSRQLQRLEGVLVD